MAAKKKATKAKPKKSPSNVISDPAQSLQTFDLLDLAQYTQEQTYATSASKDFHLFYALDKSQSGGAHEKALLASDVAKNPAAFNTSITTGEQSANLAAQRFVIGQSATHQISHTKGFVADGKVGAEGSTNWSSSGEGTFVVAGKAGGPNYKAQNNTQSIFTDPDTLSRFSAELVREHVAAAAQAGGTPASKVPPPPAAAKQAAVKAGVIPAK